MPVVAECDDGWLNTVAARPGRRGRRPRGPGRRRRSRGRPRRRAARRRRDRDDLLRAQGRHRYGVARGRADRPARVVGRARTPPATPPSAGPTYTVGVLALTNFGRIERLTIDGVRVGEALVAEGWPERVGERARPGARQLHRRRRDRRAPARRRPSSASPAGPGSGWPGPARSPGTGRATSSWPSRPGCGSRAAAPDALRTVEVVDDEYLDPFFGAVVDATEAAVLDALFRADTVDGRDGHVVPGLPVERTLPLLPRPGRSAPMTDALGTARPAGRAGRGARRRLGRAAPGHRRRSGRSGRSSASSGSPGSTRPAGRWPAPPSIAGWPAMPTGLGAGITLPFAMGLLEYDLDPQQLALDVASGAVDLALEAALLLEPDRRTVAEAEATPPGRRGRSSGSTPNGPPGTRRSRCSATRRDRGSGRRSASRTRKPPSTRPARSSLPGSTSSGSRCRSVASWPPA